MVPDGRNVPKTDRLCRLCGSNETTVFQVIDRFTYTECSRCHFRQVAETLSSAEIAAFYESGYGTPRHRQGQTVNAGVNMCVLERLGLADAPARALDVGCGYGFLLAALRSRGWPDPVGVELSNHEADYARRVLGATVHESLDEVEPASFDIVLALEVVEHILHPLEFVREIARRARPGGIVVIGTDNFRSWPVQAMGSAFPKWIPHEHISLFDSHTLPLLLEKAGLTVERTLSFTPWELLARAAAYRLSGRRVGGREFRLETVRQDEEDRPYPLFGLRARANKHWARLTAAQHLGKEMMIASARVPPAAAAAN